MIPGGICLVPHRLCVCDPPFIIVPSYYKRLNTGKGDLLPCVGCYQLPFRVTLLVVTLYFSVFCKLINFVLFLARHDAARGFPIPMLCLLFSHLFRRRVATAAAATAKSIGRASEWPDVPSSSSNSDFCPGANADFNFNSVSQTILHFRYFVLEFCRGR